MKYVIDDFEKLYDSDVEKFQEAIAKAYAIEHNAEYLSTYKDRLGVFSEHDIVAINQYGDNYADEFYIEMAKSVESSTDTNDKILYIEVLTADEAEYNEREYMDDNDSFSDEEKANYLLGVTVQWYLPLGKSQYWYRLL